MMSTPEGKNLIQQEQILPFKSWPQLGKAGKNENGRVISPGSVLIHLNSAADEARF